MTNGVGQCTRGSTLILLLNLSQKRRSLGLIIRATLAFEENFSFFVFLQFW